MMGYNGDIWGHFIGYIYIYIYWHKPNSCNSEHDLEHDFWHEGDYEKARSRARFLARGKAPKSTIFGTRESTKKHDLEHDFLHEGKHRKARFCARRKTLKTTFAQNIKKSCFWLLQLLGRTDSIYIYIYYLFICLKNIYIYVYPGYTLDTYIYMYNQPIDIKLKQSYPVDDLDIIWRDGLCDLQTCAKGPTFAFEVSVSKRRMHTLG